MKGFAEMEPEACLSFSTVTQERDLCSGLGMPHPLLVSSSRNPNSSV